ncbi:MAG: ABC transporter permease [Hyphomicrobiales bacterium]
MRIPPYARPRDGFSLTGRAPAFFAVLLIGYFLIWPLIMLAFGALRTSPFGTAGTWTLSGYATVISDHRTLPTLVATIVYAGVSTACCMLLGLYFATVATRFSTALHRLITPAMVVLVATPRLFYALSWGMLGNSNSGLFASALHRLGVGQLPDWATVYSWPGLLLVTSLKLTGFAYLLLYGPVSRIDLSLEDAAVMAGVARHRAFFDVTVTALTPALLAAGMLMFVDVLQVFDLPAVLGMPAGIHTLPIRVNDYLLETTQPNWAAASALSTIIVVVIAILLVVQRRMMRDRDFVTIGGKAGSSSRADIGRWRIVVDISILAFLLIAILLPIAQVALGSFQPFFGLYGVWTLANYRTAVGDPDVVRALWITLAIAVVGGFITVVASFGMAHLMQRRPNTPLAILSRIGSWVPATAPGIVLSLALLWSYLNTPIVRQLFGTPWLMLFALVVGSIPIGVRTCEGIVAQVGREVEEAARICGARNVTAIAEITARLCTPSLLAAWFLVGLNISGTLDIPLLLQSINAQTVATMTYQLYTYGKVPQAAAVYCLYLSCALLVPTVIVIMFGLRRVARASLPHASRRVAALAEHFRATR